MLGKIWDATNTTRPVIPRTRLKMNWSSENSSSVQIALFGSSTFTRLKHPNGQWSNGPHVTVKYYEFGFNFGPSEITVFGLNF